MNRHLKAGLVGLVGAGIMGYAYNHIESTPVKLAIEIPLALATVTGIITLQRKEKYTLRCRLPPRDYENTPPQTRMIRGCIVPKSKSYRPMR